MKAILGALVFIALATVGAAQGVPRVVLQTSDLSTPGREAITAVVEFLPGMATDRHTHPGEMVGYVLEGTFTTAQAGQPDRTFNAGQSFIIPADSPHVHSNNGPTPARMFVTYIVEKGRPLYARVPEP